jgi:hypothetical protein
VEEVFDPLTGPSVLLLAKRRAWASTA